MSYAVINDNKIHYLGPDREKALLVFDAILGDARLERVESLEALADVLNGHNDVKAQCCGGDCTPESPSLDDTADAVLLRGLDLLNGAYSGVKNFAAKHLPKEMIDGLVGEDQHPNVRWFFAKAGDKIVNFGERIKTESDAEIEKIQCEDERQKVRELITKACDWTINCGKKFQSEASKK